MIHSITRITSLVLVFGFFIGCSTLSSTNKKKSQELTEAQLQKQLDSLNTLLSQEPSPKLFYKKGLFLTELALKKENPRQRPSIYRNARQALNKSVELSNASNSFNDKKAQELLKVTWSHEHNQGVRILQQDSTLANPDYERAAAHFNNATIVIPDSSISYEMEARAYYKNQQNERAISALVDAKQNIEQAPVSLLEQLAFLYLETEQAQKAIAIYEEAEPFSNQNLNLLHGLSNAYITAGQHQKAVELLQSLIESKPKNIIYRQSLATELYFIADQKLESVVSALQNGETLEETALETVDSLLNRAENQYQQILNDSPDNPEVQRGLALFYQNNAAKYQQLLPLVEEQDEQLIKDNIEQLLSSSIPLLEQLAGQQPDDEQIWKSLYRAYSYLGMQEKADNAQSNF
ncbi:MAG TPA: tetratricopeptide repeat protein [Balneolaceae bacterium]